MRNWIAAVAAALLVLAVGTALASVPSGTSTAFNVQDPSVGVIASGQVSTAEGVSPNCAFTAEKLVFCHDSELDFTPSTDGVCQVAADFGLVGEPMLKEAGLLENVGYGIGARIGSGEALENIRVDENGLTTSPSLKSTETISRSRLVPVKAGMEYSFEPWVHSYEGAHGTLYWDLDYVCFG